MGTKSTFWSVLLAGLLVVFIGNWYLDYSKSHLLVRFDPVYSAENGQVEKDLVARVVKTPFHKASGVHVYMITQYLTKNADGFWQEDTMMDKYVEEGTTFTLFAEDDPKKHDTEYTIVCSEKELTTYDEVNKETFNPYYNNYVWIDPSESKPFFPSSIQCK